MQLTEAEIAALVGAVVILANALAAWLTVQSSKKRAAVTQAKIDRLHQEVIASPVLPVKPLKDGHNQPPVPHG